MPYQEEKGGKADNLTRSATARYSLGYTPDRADPGSRYHKISLKTTQKDLVVEAREGYHAGQ
jgi:hypothetical protein